MNMRGEDEKEVIDLMQEEMRRYRSELMCPVCKVGAVGVGERVDEAEGLHLGEVSAHLLQRVPRREACGSVGWAV